MHDSSIASKAYKLIVELTPEGYAVLADTAFQRLDNAIITTLSIQALIHTTKAQRKESAIRSSMRTAAEWGNRGLQGAYPRLTIPLLLPVDNNFRQIILLSCIHLYNFRTRLVGLNQIRTVYDSDWEETGEKSEKENLVCNVI